MNHQNGEAGNQLSKIFSSTEGYRTLSNVISDEAKLLQETKKILEKRLLLDEQYARNLQELTAGADQVAWPVNTQPIASASRDVFLQWSTLAKAISSKAEQFRRIVINDLLKELIEQKNDSKKFLEEEKRRYDLEHRKALSDAVEAEKRYLDEAKLYADKNNQLCKLQTKMVELIEHRNLEMQCPGALYLTSLDFRKGDDARVKNLEKSVIEKRGNVYRAHNDYLIKIREYNFIDEQYVQKIRALLNYHEAVELILNKSWQNLLEKIADYSTSYRDELAETMESLRKKIFLADPRRCYDELCKLHSKLVEPIAISPQVFNQLIPQTSGLIKLKDEKLLADSSTRHDIQQRIERLESSIREPILKLMDSIREKEMSYFTRKNTFEQEQMLDCLHQRRQFDEALRNDLDVALKKAGYRSDEESDSEHEELTDRLEDQAYYHGVLPRNQSVSQLKEKGDYLVRMNDKKEIVLSILWTDPGNPANLKDGHFYIYETNQMYSLNATLVSKPSVHELISYYKRQRLELREDGTQLIRAIARPDYMINNDEIQILDNLGKGNFGQVARAKYRRENVAVKILHEPPGNRTPRDRQNFINEALLLQQYKHKNIVKFIGVAATRDPLTIVMELIEQGSLNNYLRTNDVRVSQLIQMSYDIAKGMGYLEQNNVIHRDLATRNCLIDKKGRVKVADFGLSRSLKSDEEYFSQIKEFPVRWWAVEVFLGSPYTNKSDVWSYGVTIWEVFSKAETPYPEIPHNHHMINEIKHGRRLKQPDRCPTKIFTILNSCWIAEPKDRPSFERVVELLKKEKPFFLYK